MIRSEFLKKILDESTTYPKKDVDADVLKNYIKNNFRGFNCGGSIKEHILVIQSLLQPIPIIVGDSWKTTFEASEYYINFMNVKRLISQKIKFPPEYDEDGTLSSTINVFFSQIREQEKVLLKTLENHTTNEIDLGMFYKLSD